MGFVVDKDGFILTKASEMRGNVECQTMDGRRTSAKLVGVVDASGAATVKTWQDLCLAAALVGLGSGVNITSLRRLGGRPFVLGAASWVVVAATSLAGVTLIG